MLALHDFIRIVDKLSVDLTQEAQNELTNDTVTDSISGQIESTTARSAEIMSSADVDKSTEIIELVLDRPPEVELSNTTLENLISTVDNLQTHTEIEEMRKIGTSEKFRSSAVHIVGEFAMGKSSNETFKPMTSVG